MKIVIPTDSAVPAMVIVNLVERGLIGTRFTAEVSQQSRRTIKVRNVRLLESKPYCGNHPNACEFGGRDRKARYLEGADWVEFNDLINSALDARGIFAGVHTSVCVIRKGTKRRINYDSVYHSNGFRNFAVWQREGEAEDYADYCFRTAPASTFPDGTPGQYARIEYACVG